MIRQAWATIEDWCSAMLSPVGLHRLQARKPAASASSQVAWNRTFSRSASLDGQVGLQ